MESADQNYLMDNSENENSSGNTQETLLFVEQGLLKPSTSSIYQKNLSVKDEMVEECFVKEEPHYDSGEGNGADLEIADENFTSNEQNRNQEWRGDLETPSASWIGESLALCENRNPEEPPRTKVQGGPGKRAIMKATYQGHGARVGNRVTAILFPATCHSVGMEQWSGAQRAFAVKAFYKNDDCVEAARRLFRRHFNLGRHDRVPSAHAIKTWVHNFEETGSALKRKPPGAPRTVRTPENVAAVRAAISQSPQRSARRHAQSMNLSRTSVQRILHKDLQL